MAVGGAAYLVSKAIKAAKVDAFADLGMEAIYEFEVQDMPVTVAVDSNGTSVHETGPAEWKARIASLRAVHNLDFSRTRRHGEDPMTDAQRREKPPVDQPVVRTHPETGRKCLYLGDHAEYIVGMPYDEGRALIEELNRLAIHPDLTYEHHWTARELMLWDNRCVMHRATAYDPATQGRVIRRCTVLGEVPH